MTVCPAGSTSRHWLLASVVLAFLLLAAGPAHATITVLNYWHLGENDPGALSGGHCTTTVDAVGGHTLTNTPVAGPFTTYTNGVSLAASAETGSSLALAFTNNQYLVGNLATPVVDNFGIECWVNTGTNAGGHVLAYNGLRGNGWGLYQSGTTYQVLYGGLIFFGSATAPMNTWMHLALVRNNGVAILYTNGVPASTNTASTPLTPTGSFTVGGDAEFGEYFVGAIDEVRVFTFAPGAFSTNDLLLNSTNLFVANTNDAGAGSLRQIIAQAAPGDRVTFLPALSGQTILLVQPLALNQSVSIDASALPDGISINGNAAGSVFYVTGGTDVFTGLTITNGNGLNGSGGGGIYNTATLTVNQCSLVGNSTPSQGGGIYVNGTLTVNNCTLAGNSSGSGGGIFLYGGTLTVNNCTLANNSSGNGGGIFNNVSTLKLTNSIVCSNTVAGSPDNIDGGFTGANNLVNANAQLAPLGNYGGPTMTMPPYAGSPALDAGSDAVTSFLATDQRGHPRKSGVHVDIGAVEVDTNSIVTLNSDTGAAGTLRYAVANIQPNDLVSFAQNLSGATILLTGSPISLFQSVTIDGSTLANAVQINGNASSPVLLVVVGTARLNSLTITNGYDASGLEAGGVHIQSTLTMDNCTIAGNLDKDGGGGIYNGGTLALNNCTLAGNNGGAGNGGGILNGNTLTLNNCTLANNRSGNSGGGIYNEVGTLNLTNSIVCSNTASADPNISHFYDTYNQGNSLVDANAQLAPLGNYGGPTMTMPPYAGSPALDAGSDAVTSFLATDQRGHPRKSGVHVDIGAVEVDTNSIVTLNSDTGAAGTLRYAVANIQPNDLVSFAQNLSGATILLTGSPISLFQSVTIDGSTLANAVQINGNASSPVLLVVVGTARLNSLTITNGYDASGLEAGGVHIQSTLTMDNCTIAGNLDKDGGGGIYNGGTLALNNCTLAGNNGSGGGGGGIYNGNTLTLNNCTLADNSSQNGGAIQNEGALAAYNSTFAANTGSAQGGAISAPFNAPTALTQCTLAGNSSGDGGGVWGTVVNLTNSIVAGNSATMNPNLSGTFTFAGNNLISGSPGLAPLGNYGGPTLTMPPTNGSPAIDMGGASILTTDQRGYPRPSGLGPDIGAVEVQYASSNNPPVLKSAMWTGAGHGNSFTFTFTNQPTVTFSVLAATNLAAPLNTWTNLGPVVESPAFSGQFPFTDASATNFPRRFYRVSSP